PGWLDRKGKTGLTSGNGRIGRDVYPIAQALQYNWPNPGDFSKIVHLQETALTATRFNNALGERRANAGHEHQFGLPRRSQLDPRGWKGRRTGLNGDKRGPRGHRKKRRCEEYCER